MDMSILYRIVPILKLRNLNQPGIKMPATSVARLCDFMEGGSH